jgi:hypothetical protein
MDLTVPMNVVYDTLFYDVMLYGYEISLYCAHYY